MSDSQPIRKRFDRLLSSYQKICVFLLFPPLISAFSWFVALFNKDYGLHLSMAFGLGLKAAIPGDPLVWTLVASLGLVAIYVPLALFSAKGKLWCFIVGVSLYVADFAYSFFLLGSIETIGFVLQMVIHGVFLIAYGFGLFFYFRADALLKAHPDEILDK